MSTDAAVDLFAGMMWVAAKVTGPVLLVALIIGLVVGVLQAATQINEASVSFVTKLLAISVTFLAIGPWILQQMIDYTTRSIESISTIVR